jgi:hypothetical protein
VKEVEHASQHPGRYVVGSLSGILSKSIDIAKNEDYFGNYVYNPNAPLGTQVKQAAKYAEPSPFVVSSFARGKTVGTGKSSWLGAFGFPRAPVDLDFTPAEKLAYDLQKSNATRKTPEETEKWRAHIEALKNGTASRKDMRAMVKRERLSWLQRDFKGLPYPDKLRVYDLATQDEKDSLSRLLRQARRNQREHGHLAEAEAAEAAEAAETR